MRSKLDPAAGDPAHLAYYRELLALRRELGDAPAEVTFDEQRRLLRMRRGPVELVANFADHEQDGVPARSGAGAAMSVRDRRPAAAAAAGARAPMRCPGGRSPRARPGTGRGRTSRCSPSTPSAVELCLFDEDGSERRIDVRDQTAFQWHVYLPGVGPGPALRLPRARPLRPGPGPALQPGQAADRPLRQGDRRRGGLEGGQHAALPARRGRGRRPRHRRPSDDAAAIPKSVVVDPSFDWGEDRLLGRRWSSTVIYETHVKGFTMRHPGGPRGAARHLRRAGSASRPSPTSQTSG